MFYRNSLQLSNLYPVIIAILGIKSEICLTLGEVYAMTRPKGGSVISESGKRSPIKAIHVNFIMLDRLHHELWNATTNDVNSPSFVMQLWKFDSDKSPSVDLDIWSSEYENYVKHYDYCTGCVSTYVFKQMYALMNHANLFLANLHRLDLHMLGEASLS